MNVIDRVESAKHTLTGSGIGKAVSKATSHEIIGPKRKHVDCKLKFIYFWLICLMMCVIICMVAFFFSSSVKKVKIF